MPPQLIDFFIQSLDKSFSSNEKKDWKWFLQKSNSTEREYFGGIFEHIIKRDNEIHIDILQLSSKGADESNTPITRREIRRFLVIVMKVNFIIIETIKVKVPDYDIYSAGKILIEDFGKIQFRFPELRSDNDFQDTINYFNGLIDSYKSTASKSKLGFKKQSASDNEDEKYRYWNHNNELLNSLLIELKEASAIQDIIHAAFNNSISNCKEKVIWNWTFPECFYLLYLINNKNEYYNDNKEKLDVVAGIIFYFKGRKEQNIRIAYNKFSKKITGTDFESYTVKKLNRVQDIYSKVFS